MKLPSALCVLAHFVRAIVFFACPPLLHSQSAIAPSLTISVSYDKYQNDALKPTNGKPLLCTFVVNARLKAGYPEEQQLSSIGKAKFAATVDAIEELGWKVSENRGFVLWPYRDICSPPPDYKKFQLKAISDVFIETQSRATELIERSEFKSAEEEFETLKQMFHGLPAPAVGTDRRAEFETSLLRSLCNNALKYRDSHRIRSGTGDKTMERVDVEADWIWELVWGSAERAAQGDIGQVIEALLLWESFARDSYVLERHHWKAKNGKKVPAFRSEEHRQRLFKQVEAVQSVLKRNPLALALTAQLQKIPSKKARTRQLKCWKAGALAGSASPMAFENLSILIDALHRYCGS